MQVANWNYVDESECGPCKWPNANSLHQSPIDLEFGKIKQISAGPLIITYKHMLSGEITNDGHTLRVVPTFGNKIPEIKGGGLDQTYRLVQYHFHWGQHDSEGSEHTLGGLHYPAELHLVHQGVNNPDKYAVIGVFLNVGNDEHALKSESKVVRKIITAGSNHMIDGIDLEQKLPKNQKSFWRYEGSLTTPPCTEVVTWTIFTEPISITKYQLALVRSLQDRPGHCLERNYRPVQKLNDREVYHVLTQ